VLVAEDNRESEIGGPLLSDWAFGGVAANGMEAVRIAEKKRYDVIMMDCQMPEIDGYGATKKFAARSGVDHRTLIAMTAHAMPENASGVSIAEW